MSPFRSLKQKEWLRKHKPGIYEDWVKKYGTKIKRSKKKKKKGTLLWREE